MTIFAIIPIFTVAAGLLIWGISYVVALNNDLAKARENEILNREIMRKQEEDLKVANKRSQEQQTGAAYDVELEMLIQNKRLKDALEYIEERRRLAFEQGNHPREDMYRRYRENIEYELRDRSQDGF